MEIGVVYPQTEFGSDPLAIRDYAQAVEGLGFSHVLAYDHVLGANPDRPGGLQGPYTYQSPFMEPFLLFSYMAAVTQRLGFATGIIILPQRQTALAAKQAATLDILCRGRLRLGVGLGWNAVEYTALGEDFHTRGRKIEEQVTLMRSLWTEPLVNFTGRWHTIPDAGINPLPIQRPIPVWFGAKAQPAIRRAVRLGDGWMTNHKDVADARQALDQLDQAFLDTGKDPSGFGIEARIPYGHGDPTTWERLVAEWQEAGATCFSVNTMAAGLKTPAAHLAALENFAKALGVSR